MRNSHLMTIFPIVFIDLLGFSLILPLLPSYAESYGAIATVIGLLVASYAVAQLIDAPLLGRLSLPIGASSCQPAENGWLKRQLDE